MFLSIKTSQSIYMQLCIERLSIYPNDALFKIFLKIYFKLMSEPLLQIIKKELVCCHTSFWTQNRITQHDYPL